ncbi:MAG TPA: hypothetical protein PKN11_09480, partial [Anaerolineaceae bacterium]|nr:hypothetical protein [Anaerolineaceae bacterium]
MDLRKHCVRRRVTLLGVWWLAGMLFFGFPLRAAPRASPEQMWEQAQKAFYNRQYDRSLDYLEALLR